MKSRYSFFCWKTKKTANVATETKGVSVSSVCVAEFAQDSLTPARTDSHRQTRRGHSTPHREITFSPSGSLPAPYWVLSPWPSSDNQTNWSGRSLQAIRAHQSPEITRPLTKTINVLRESVRRRLGQAKTDSLVGWANLWNNENGSKGENILCFFSLKCPQAELQVRGYFSLFIVEQFFSPSLMTRKRNQTPMSYITVSGLAEFGLLDN